MTEVGLVHEDFLINVVRLVAVEVDDLQTVREDCPRPRAEADRGVGRIDGPERMLVFGQPVFQAKDDQIDARAIAAKGARGIEQLLEDLIVGRKFDPRIASKMLSPKTQRVLQRLCGEGGSHAQSGLFRRRRFAGCGTVNEGQRDPGEFPKEGSIGIHDLDDASLCGIHQRGASPPRSRPARCPNHKAVNRLENEGPPAFQAECREELRGSIEEGWGQQTVPTFHRRGCIYEPARSLPARPPDVL